MTTAAPTRRLSPVRVTIALVATVCAVTGGALWATAAISDAVSPTVAPWFAGYVDVTATPSYAFENPVSDAGNSVVLSFIVSETSDACTPSWGSVYTLDQAATSLDLDRRIVRLDQQGGEAIVSFGGLNNDELAVGCTDTSDLETAYASVVDRYDLSTIDLDLEGGSLATEVVARQATAIAGVQAARATSGDPLAVWLTLPVTTDGLTVQGTDAVAAYLAAGVDVAGVNAMTMNFGDSLATGQSESDGSIQALTSVHRQLGVLYSAAGISLSNKTLWSKVGATPMAGQNDIAAEVFTIADATALNSFVLENGLGRTSMWSMNRDLTCGPNYAGLSTVSDSCSGVDQGTASFATALAADLTGTPDQSSTTVTTSEPADAVAADDPATSPYAIWSEDSVYLAGTKVVWHHYVYEAKWWTQSDLPDNPVLQSSSTPWQLVGPVLAGETPVALPTLPAGTYAEWSAEATYLAGDRVLLNGVAYAAKWWTEGDSPEAASVDSDSSPWKPLTDAEILAVLDQ
jgi:chitinase